MILPYRTKNPPEHFPFVTISLMVLNVLLYALTSSTNSFLQVDESALRDFAVTHSNLSLWRLTSAMFLHANIEHLLGNMLFLWLFGAAAEGRMRPLKFLIMYFVAGWTGGLLSDLILGTSHPDTYSLGASGAIMGVAGAYLYMFPYSIICVFYGFRFRWGVADWQARWVVLLYVGMDVLFAVLFRGADGVGHFAHIGGFGTGLLAALLLRVRRDTEAVSQAQATVSDVKKDYSLLSLSELESLLQHPTEDMNLVLAYCEKTASHYGGARYDLCLGCMNHYASRLFAQADPNRLAQILISIPPNVGGMPLVFYLRLGSRLESITSNSMAIQIYRRIYDLAPTAPDTEMALYRMAQIMQNAFGDRQNARATYLEMLRLFPQGQMALQAQRALQQTGF